MNLLPIATATLFAGTVLALGFRNASVATTTIQPTALRAAAESYTIDSAHSSVIFRIKHMDVAYFYGRFNEVAGEILLDEEHPEKSTVTMTIQAASVDSNSEGRDKHIKSPDFLDAKQFPEMTFTSKTVERDGATWKMAGELELHGARKPLTLEFEKTGEGPGLRGGTIAGFHTRFTIDRTEWGMDYLTDGPLAKQIELTISLEAARP